MTHYCVFSSYLLLILLLCRFPILIRCGTGSPTVMDTGHNSSTLTVDSPEYVLFTGDLTVNYTLGDVLTPDDVQIHLMNHVDGSKMAALPLPSNTSEGQLVIVCGAISSTGSIVFVLSVKDSDLVVAVSDVVHARWPQVTIRTLTGSRSFSALTENIAVDIINNDWDRLSCHPKDSSTEYSVSLDYYGSSDFSPDSPSPRSMYRTNIARFFERKEHSVTFHCRFVDQPGDYLVVLRSPKFLTITVSEFLEVHWNPGSYELQSTLTAVFPCSTDVVVSFTRPRCANDDDKVRLYRQLRHENVTLASSSTLSYVAERRTRKSSNEVSFGCSEFEEELAPAYCWKYVSTAKSGATYEHRTLCLPATTKDRPVNGQWSTWSEWSSCSATCLSGTQVRFRSCDNPPPANGGAFCVGPMTESRQCDVICPELSPPTTTYFHIPSTNSSCDCGCRLTDTEGTVVALPGCPSGVAQWVIAVKDGLTIRLTFRVFDLENDERTSVRVRDGESAMSDLLLNSYGAGSPADVVSTGSVLTIEFRAPVNSSGGGFVAKYSVQARNTSLLDGFSQTEESPSESTPIWKSVVIIVGVSLCVAVVVIAVIIVCCDVGASRAKRRRKKKRLNTKGHTVAFDAVPKTYEPDYDEVPKNETIPVIGGGGLDVVRVYPSAGSDDIPSHFLATSSPYLDAGRGRHSSKMKRSRTKEATSEKNVEDEGPVPTASLKTGRNQKGHFLEVDDGVVAQRRRSKSRDRKRPQPSSTFEEDLLMLARQTEVTGGGAVALTIDTGTWGSGTRPVPSKPKGESSRSKSKLKGDIAEKIPLQSMEVKGRSRKSRKHHSSSQPRVATQEVKGRGHRVSVGQRPPVEGSYDTVPDSSCRTSADVTIGRKELLQGQRLALEPTMNHSTLKDGSSFKDGSGAVMTLTVDFDPRLADSDKPNRSVDRAPNYDPGGSGKNASFRSVHGNTSLNHTDHALHIQSFLRPDTGPDGRSQGGTFHSNSNSLTCSNSPTFRMSTERTSKHTTFRPGPPRDVEPHRRSPNATPPCPAKLSSPLRPGITPQMVVASEPVFLSSHPVSSSSAPGESQLPLGSSDHRLEEETRGASLGTKTDPQNNGTISGPL